MDVGKEFGLSDTPCVKMLEEAIAVCNRGASQKVTAGLTGADKICQRYTRNTAPSFAATLQGFVLREIPIFNILEAICWIYTCCVPTDEILTDREAECYLYQLLLIFQALKATKWISSALIPSTVAAAWSRPFGNAPLKIVFACTCVGKDKVRLEMNMARKEYVKGLHALVENCSSVGAQNKPGNCPEFVSWGALCRGRQEYRSLCLNLVKYRSYKFCTHCDSLAKAAREGSKVKIEDWYDKTSLRETEPMEQDNGYVSCDLKSLKAIIAEGRGRKVYKY